MRLSKFWRIRFISLFPQRSGMSFAPRWTRRQRICRDCVNCLRRRASSMSLSRPSPIEKIHDTASFACGVDPLNEYLRKYALVNHQNRSARTYVALRDGRVVGYYALAAGSVSRDEVPHRVAQGLGRYPVPITILARLAVDISEEGRGLGKSLLKDAVLRALQASELAGSRAIVAHAKDETAKEFYRKFDFVPSPVNEMHLYLLMKDVQLVVRGDLTGRSGRTGRRK